MKEAGASVMSNNNDLLYEKHGRVVNLIFNRPKTGNAVTSAMFIEMERHLIAIADDKDVRVIVLKGRGTCFSAGADIMPDSKGVHRRTQTKAFPEDKGGNSLERCNRCILRLQQLKQPVIACVNGPAIGVGASLALAADLRIAASTARLGLGFSRVGLAPDGGASYFLRNQVGIAKALEILFLGDVLGAEQALAMGLINWMVAPEELAEATENLVTRLAQGPGLAYALAKNSVYAGANLSFEAALDLEARNQAIAARSRDAKEGVQAFLERRDPLFHGC